MNEQDKLKQLENEFKECRAVLAAIGDETRQSIILSLMKGTYPGIRVGEITKKNTFVTSSCFASFKNIKRSKNCNFSKTRNDEFLSYKSSQKRFDSDEEVIFSC